MLNDSYGQKFVDFIAKTYNFPWSMPVSKLTAETKKEFPGAMGFWTGTSMELLAVDEKIARTVLHELCHKFIDTVVNPEIRLNMWDAIANKLWPGELPVDVLKVWGKDEEFRDTFAQGLEELLVVETVEKLSGSSEAGYRSYQIDRLEELGEQKFGKKELGLTTFRLAEHFLNKLNLKKGPTIETTWRRFKETHPNGTASEWELKKAEYEEQLELGTGIFREKRESFERRHPEKVFHSRKRPTTPSVTTPRIRIL